MKIGTKSVLFGAHQFLIHPWFVAWAWWKLYGFPFDPRLWVAFFVHDLGYWGCADMDGEEGEWHVVLGAKIMGWLFDEDPLKAGPRWIASAIDWINRGERFWYCFCFYHSRYMAKRYGVKHSRLCVADKLAVALEPWWLYLPRVILTGEIDEYMSRAGGAVGSKYTGEPKLHKYSGLNLLSNDLGLSLWTRRRIWFDRMTNYLLRWSYVHRDGRDDTWTRAKPSVASAIA